MASPIRSPPARATWSRTATRAISFEVVATATSTIGLSDIATSTTGSVVFPFAVTTAGGSTDQPNQTISGTDAPGSIIVDLYAGDSLLATATVGAGGTWSAPVTLSVGTDAITAADNAGLSATIGFTFNPITITTA